MCRVLDQRGGASSLSYESLLARVAWHPRCSMCLYHQKSESILELNPHVLRCLTKHSKMSRSVRLRLATMTMLCPPAAAVNGKFHGDYPMAGFCHAGPSIKMERSPGFCYS